jgi:hypothetical protein
MREKQKRKGTEDRVEKRKSKRNKGGNSYHIFKIKPQTFNVTVVYKGLTDLSLG